MKYSITFNQLAGHTISAELGVPLDVVDLSIFDVMLAFSGAPICAKMQQGERIWFNIPYKDVIRQLPLSGITSNNAMYKRYKRLEAARIIELNANNATMNQSWIAWGPNYQRLLFNEAHLSKAEPRAQNKGVDEIGAGAPPDGNAGSKVISSKAIGNDSAGNPAPAEKKQSLIHLMVAAFEAEHQKHFVENGTWVGFNWGAAKSIENGKEFGALKSLKTKLEKRVVAKLLEKLPAGSETPQVAEKIKGTL